MKPSQEITMHSSPNGEPNRIMKLLQTAATSHHNDLTPPTEAQAKSGNYKKAVVRRNGLIFMVEQPAGSKRCGEWGCTNFSDAYGYIKGYMGLDGDPIDCYLGDHFLQDRAELSVFRFFIRNDDNPLEIHDEKLMIGFDTLEEAKACLRGHYKGSEKPYVEEKEYLSMSIFELKGWLEVRKINAIKKESIYSLKNEDNSGGGATSE